MHPPHTYISHTYSIYYAHTHTRALTYSSLAVIVLLQGIGNCAQGLIDAIIFVAFTPTIRKRLVRVIMCRGKVLEKPTRFFKESKNYYDNNLRNYSPRYSLSSSSPVNIVSTRTTASPEPSTSFHESPTDDYFNSNYSIQNEQSNRHVYYSNS